MSIFPTPENALSQTPITASDWAAQAKTLRSKGEQAEALAAAAQALRLDPTIADMWDCIGFLLLERGRWQEARHYLSQASHLVPDDVSYRCHLAIALMELDAFDEAQQQLEAAVRLDPGSAEAQHFMAELLCRTGYYDYAISYFEAARTDARFKQAATFGEGAALFLTGAFEAGLEFLSQARPTIRNLPLPEWKGEIDPKLHLILSGEHGFGDIIHLIRYARQAKKRVGKVTLGLPYHLMDLCRQSLPEFPIHIYQVPEGKVLPENVSKALPTDASMQCFYLNLPYVLAPFDAKAIDVPYIKANPQLVLQWQERFKAVPHPRIGLVWSGNPRHQNDHNRSVPFDALEPLLAAAPGHFVSMQLGERQKDAAPAGLFNAAQFITDFSDSAAAFEALDLLITIDSGPAHLAGAMGRPVWTLLPFNPDWRWLLGREDSIWYPSMKLYRQPAIKDWADVIDQLRIDIEKLCAGDATILRPAPWDGTHLRRHPGALDISGLEHGGGFV